MKIHSDISIVRTSPDSSFWGRIDRFWGRVD